MTRQQRYLSREEVRLVVALAGVDERTLASYLEGGSTTRGSVRSRIATALGSIGRVDAVHARDVDVAVQLAQQRAEHQGPAPMPDDAELEEQRRVTRFLESQEQADAAAKMDGAEAAEQARLEEKLAAIQRECGIDDERTRSIVREMLTNELPALVEAQVQRVLATAPARSIKEKK